MSEGSTDQVVAFVRDLIVGGRLRPGDRLPSERELALRIGVSRPSVRAGLHALAAMGVVRSKHGSGTYIPAGPPVLGSEPLRFLAALHGFTREEMWEARRILEVEAAGLAAERATHEHLARLAGDVAGMFANRDHPQLFLVHDVDFHRAVADAAKNPIIGTLVGMVSAMYYERRKEKVERASDRDLRDAAEAHRRVYQAIRAGDAAAARRAMNDHLLQAARYQAQEPDKPASAREPARRATPARLA